LETKNLQSNTGRLQLGLHTAVQYQWWSTDQLMKKSIDFNVEIKFRFQWKYWMTLDANWIELNWNKLNGISIQLFNSPVGWRFDLIEFKFNWRQMGCKLVQKVLKICLWIWCWKKKRLQKQT
jgi:hypothetical protein